MSWLHAINLRRAAVVFAAFVTPQSAMAIDGFDTVALRFDNFMRAEAGPI